MPRSRNVPMAMLIQAYYAINGVGECSVNTTANGMVGMDSGIAVLWLLGLGLSRDFGNSIFLLLRRRRLKFRMRNARILLMILLFVPPSNLPIPKRILASI